VGGKAYSRFYRGVWTEFGTVFLSDIYDQVAKLMEKYNTGFQIVSKATPTVWASDNGWYRLLNNKACFSFHYRAHGDYQA
jgi:hypothetical protein